MNATNFLKQMDGLNAMISQKWGITLMRFSLAIIYIWFGLLKPFGLSPACHLVEHAVFWFSADWFIPALGIWESAIGLMLLFKPTVRLAVLMIYLHIPGTFLPFLTYPESAMTQQLFELTLAGQYMVKNLTILVIALTIGGSLNKDSHSVPITKNQIQSIQEFSN